jgi:ubiquinone/menaquinone biosynthesis C-methylase UbiE
MYHDDLRTTYDIWSQSYDTSPNPLIAVEEMVVRSLLRTLEAHKVLDAATGTGRYALYLASQGKEVTAVDANESMLREARRKAQEQQLAIHFLLEDISALSCPDESFDLVICALALLHLDEITLPCQELVRVLRPGGNLIISDLHPYLQAHRGPDFYDEELVPGQELYFPNFHGHVDNYLMPLKRARATIVACLDAPYMVLSEQEQEEYIAIPGVLVLWAQK